MRQGLPWLDQILARRLDAQESAASRDGGLLLLRVTFGLSMATTHGWATWRGLMTGDGNRFPDPLGLGSEASMALMGFAELWCAGAVAVGLLTRLATIPLVFGLAVAFLIFHADDPFSRRELALLYLTAFTAIGLLGPGRYSLDRLLAGRRFGAGSATWGRLAATALSLSVLGCSETASPPEAARLISESLSAIGRPEDLAAFGTFEVSATGTLDKTAEGQGFAPNRPSPGPFQEAFVVDAATGRIAWEYREDRYDGTFEAFREVYPAEGQRLYVVHDPPLVIPARSKSFAAARRPLLRRVPHLALAELLQRPDDLSVSAAVDEKVDVLGRLGDGTEMTVQLDRKTGYPIHLSYRAVLSGKGTTEVTWWFDDYRPVEGLGLYPFRYGSLVGRHPYTTLRVTSLTAGEAERFDAPQGYRRLEERDVDASAGPESALRPLEVEEVAPGVFRVPEVRGGFAPLVVAHDDFLIVVDAPASYPVLGKIPAEETDPAESFSWHSERLVAALGSKFPQRPVRYLVLTHAHEDHVGGVRAFVAAGAKVVATAPVHAVVRRLVELSDPALTDRLAEVGPQPSRFEVVTEARTIGSGPRRVALLPVGDNPHAEGMLIVHMPGSRLVFISDLVTPGGLESYPRAAHASLDRFVARWLDRQGLKPSKILAMHGAPFATAEHMIRAGANAPEPDA